MLGLNGITKVLSTGLGLLQILENIKALQDSQKEMAVSIEALGKRVTGINAELRALRAEIETATTNQVHAAVSSTLGGLNQRLENVTVKVAVLEHDVSGIKTIDGFAGRALPRPPADG